MTGRWRRLGTGVLHALSVLAVLASVAYVGLALGGYERYVITGRSMTGTYDLGSLVVEEHVPVDRLKVGDVITYVPPADSGVHQLVTHRIVSIETGPAGRTMRTKGDANPDVDPWRFTLHRPTQPVVRGAVPYVGWVLIAMADRTLRMLVVGVPATLVALGALRQLVTALRHPAHGAGRPTHPRPGVVPAGPA